MTEDTSSYVDALIGDYELEGRTYGLPFARSTPLFYYNKQVWDRAGLPDRGPESWDEFLDWAPRIQEAIGEGKHAIAMYDGSNYLDWTAANLVWNLGGAYSREWEATFTDPGTIAAMEYLKQLDDEGYLVVSADSITEFGAGIAACAAASTGSLTSARTNATFDFNTAFMPGAQDDNSCPTGGAGLAIPAGISIPEIRAGRSTGMRTVVRSGAAPTWVTPGSAVPPPSSTRSSTTRSAAAAGRAGSTPRSNRLEASEGRR